MEVAGLVCLAAGALFEMDFGEAPVLCVITNSTSWRHERNIHPAWTDIEQPPALLEGWSDSREKEFIQDFKQNWRVQRWQNCNQTFKLMKSGKFKLNTALIFLDSGEIGVWQNALDKIQQVSAGALNSISASLKILAN